ncbi:hypothetical protein [Streptomyces exfoliatus]|uniref:hypothetical protein n=1 Tax=Streptomyces exfoliatus TaxID=1905 RepID=UPI003C3047A4
MPAHPSPGPQSVDRALAVLDAVADADRPVGPVFRIMPGSRGLARTLAALSSVPNAPR